MRLAIFLVLAAFATVCLASPRTKRQIGGIGAIGASASRRHGGGRGGRGQGQGRDGGVGGPEAEVAGSVFEGRPSLLGSFSPFGGLLGQFSGWRPDDGVLRWGPEYGFGGGLGGGQGGLNYDDDDDDDDFNNKRRRGQNGQQRRRRPKNKNNNRRPNRRPQRDQRKPQRPQGPPQGTTTKPPQRSTNKPPQRSTNKPPQGTPQNTGVKSSNGNTISGQQLVIDNTIRGNNDTIVSDDEATAIAVALGDLNVNVQGSGNGTNSGNNGIINRTGGTGSLQSIDLVNYVDGNGDTLENTDNASGENVAIGSVNVNGDSSLL